MQNLGRLRLEILNDSDFGSREIEEIGEIGPRLQFETNVLAFVPAQFLIPLVLAFKSKCVNRTGLKIIK